MKFDCKDVWQQLSAYVDNDLSPEVREDIEAHLAQCRHCAALFDSTHNVLILVADERRFELPLGFGARLRKRLEQEFADTQIN